MAIFEIVTTEGISMEHSFARGNGGVLVDVQGGRQNEFTLPALGGSCTYPSEDDVRDGVVFGGIYMGNLVLPLEADVELGVQYGANGTEFTGSFAGGGSEHSYTFVS